MKKFSESIITEGRSDNSLQAEINRYVTAMSGKLPRRVQSVLYILSKYPSIKTKEEILAIRDGHMRVYDKLGILPADLKDLQKMLKGLGSDIRLLPHFLNEHQRQALEHNKLGIEDVTLDLKSKAGREHAAKQYMPVVMKVVNYFAGKCSMSKEDLMSAGMEGLVTAMNTYKTEDEMDVDGKKSTTPFGAYVWSQARLSILNELNDHGSLIGQSDYMRRKEGGASISSIDGKYGQDEDGDDIKIDRLMDLSEEPDYDLNRDEEKAFATVFKKMEKKFSTRDCHIFYRATGLNGFEKEQGKTIARSIGVSAPAITQTVQKIINWMKQDEDTLEVLRGILNVVECNMLVKLIDLDHDMVVESIIRDDMYLLFENANRWSSPAAFTRAIDKATDSISADSALYIFKSLKQGREYFDENFKRNRNAIVNFLNNLYPADSYSRKSDQALYDAMYELIDFSIKNKIVW